MNGRAIVLAGILLLGSGSLGLAQLTTQQDVQTKLEHEGYTQIQDFKFGSDGINAKAVKDGKEWSLVLDSSGKIIQQEG